MYLNFISKILKIYSKIFVTFLQFSDDLSFTKHFSQNITMQVAPIKHFFKNASELLENFEEILA